MTEKQDASSYHEYTHSAELCPLSCPILKYATSDMLQFHEAMVHCCCVSLQGLGRGTELCPLSAVLGCAQQSRVLIPIDISVGKVKLNKLSRQSETEVWGCEITINIAIQWVYIFIVSDTSLPPGMFP